MREKYSHINREERQVIYKMHKAGHTLRKIAEFIGRAASAAGSISRELRRNQHPFPVMRRHMSGLEKAAYAHERTKERRKIPRKHECLSDPEVRQKVIELLVKEGAAPLDISFRIPELLPGRSISPRTIYNFTKKRRPDLQEYLRLHGKPRKQRVVKRRGRFKEGAPTKRRIDERPAHIEQNIEFGNWETDCILSCKGGSGWGILTLRERKSRRRFFFLIPDLKAETVTDVLLEFFAGLPPHLRKTLTVDNGSEFEHLYKLEQRFPGFKVYYCHPHSPWERGQVENANGEFRWYFPKGTDFSLVDLAQVLEVEAKLNRRHMLCLGRKSSAAVFDAAWNNPSPIIFPEKPDLRGYRSLADEKISDSRPNLDFLFAQSWQTPQLGVPDSLLSSRSARGGLADEYFAWHQPAALFLAEETLHWRQNLIHLPP
jgi:IS30 family transposase